MMRRAVSGSVLSLLFLVLGSAAAGCSTEVDDGSATDDADYTEGSGEAKAVFALLNDASVTAEELVSGAKVTTPVGRDLVAHRNGPDGRVGTQDDDPFDSLREVDEVPGVGPATIKKLFEYAKSKGYYSPGGASGATRAIFSPAPADNNHLTEIAKEIDKAQASVDVAIYSFSDAKITDALGRAVARGVKVRLVFNDAPADARLPAAAQANSKSAKLEAAGINVRYINKIMHHKFAIIDGPRSELAAAKTARLISGSANWSNSAATRYDENTVFFNGNEELNLRFQREFDNMWAHSRDFVGKDLPYELSTTSITDAVLQSAEKTSQNVFFTSANFTPRDTTFSGSGTNAVADPLVAAIQSATRSIKVASGHLRSRPIAEALIAKKAATPSIDIKVYLDGQEFIAKGTHDIQVDDLNACIAAATTPAKKRACTDKGFLFGYQVGQAGIDVRYKYYAYRWDHGYAPQMHHKFMLIDGSRLYSGSYNLSDNAEHETFENMMMLDGAENAALVKSFDDNFEKIWNTGKADNKLASLNAKIDAGGNFPIVFDAMALSWAEVSALKTKIRSSCPAVDSQEYRSSPASHQFCDR